MREDTRPGASEIIQSDTFKPTGKHLGMGCWGTVDVYNDPIGQNWAIKRFCPNDVARQQMTQRGWTEEHVMRSEGLPLDAAKHHLVPRIIERDKQGNLYVGMPVYDYGRTLADYKSGIARERDRDGVKKRLGILRDIADALGYLHSRPHGDFFGVSRDNTAHGDVKPSNIFFVDGHASLGDLGSSTCISIGGHGSPRGTHGDVNYRAPECFADDAQPSTRADIWSLGAIAYELDTGRGIYEGIDASKMPKEELQKEISRRIRTASRDVRPILKRCLAVNPVDRFQSGISAQKYLEKRLEGLNGWGLARKHLGWAGPVAAAASMIAWLVYAESTYEPKKLGMPTVQTQNVSPGLLYLKTEAGKSKNAANPIEFVSENITNLYVNPPVRGMVTEGIDRRSKLCTDNRVVAYLTKAEQWAWWSKHGFIPPVSDEQQALYDSTVRGDERVRQESLSGPVYPVVARSIENAITRSIRPDGKVDLEDTIAISRLGERTVKLAKLRSDSDRYEAYRWAKNSDGTSMIPKREREFIETSIYYAENDVDLIVDDYEAKIHQMGAKK